MSDKLKNVELPSQHWTKMSDFSNRDQKFGSLRLVPKESAQNAAFFGKIDKCSTL